MKYRLRYGIFYLILSFLSACESTSNEMRILEKSRQVEPAWLAEGLGLKSGPGEIRYTLCKEKVLDLPLGLEQAEASVLHNLRFQIFQLVLSHINSAGLSAASKQDLNQQLGKILDRSLTKTNLKDFYFDKVSIPLVENGLIPEYYRIFVLAQIDEKQRVRINDEIKAFVKSYPNEDLRSRLGTITQF